MECRRSSPGPRRVRTQREARKPGGYGDGRSGTGSARNILTVEAVATGSVRRAGAQEAGGERVEIGFAQRYRPGFEQPLNARGRSGRHVRKPGTAGRGRHAGQVDIVLDDEWDSVQRLRLDGSQLQRAHMAHDLGAGETIYPDGGLASTIWA